MQREKSLKKAASSLKKKLKDLAEKYPPAFAVQTNPAIGGAHAKLLVASHHQSSAELRTPCKLPWTSLVEESPLVEPPPAGPSPRHNESNLRLLLANLKGAGSPVHGQPRPDNCDRSCLIRYSKESVPEKLREKLLVSTEMSQFESFLRVQTPSKSRLLEENIALKTEVESLKQKLRQTKLERLFWKEKVIEMEKRVDQRTLQHLKHKERESSRLYSMEKKEEVSFS